MTPEVADAYIDWLHKHSPVEQLKIKEYAQKIRERRCHHNFDYNRVCCYCGASDRNYEQPCSTCKGGKYIRGVREQHPQSYGQIDLAFKAIPCPACDMDDYFLNKYNINLTEKENLCPHSIV